MFRVLSVLAILFCFWLSASAQYSTNCSYQAPVGCWHFDEASGSSLSDSSGNSNTATATGTTVVTGILNNARHFNGSSDFIDVANVNNFLFSSAFSVTAWVKRDRTGTEEGIFTKALSSGWASGGKQFFINSTDHLTFGAFGFSDTSSTPILSTGVWYFIAVTWNTTGNTVTLYLNGASVGSATMALGADPGGENVRIGERADSMDFLQGTIDEVHFYQSALTSAQVYTLYSSASTGGQYISAPILPQATPNSTYPPDTGYTITPLASGGNLQTAINNMACGTKLNLTHNGNFTAVSQFTLPALDVLSNSCACHTDPTKWRIIQSDAFEANYTAGIRLDPSTQYSNLAHIANSDPNYTFEANINLSNCWGFAGLDVTETTAGANAVFSWGDGSLTTANYPHDFGIWWCYIHGQPTLNLGFGAKLGGNSQFVLDSYISDIHRVAQDATGIVGIDGFGPYLIQNNTIMGSAENIMFGGAAPQPNVTMADISVIGNYLFKPLTWWRNDSSYAGVGEPQHIIVKNLLEFKIAQRVLVTRNVSVNNWVDGQTGSMHLLNEGCSSASTPNSLLMDVTEFYNIYNGAHGSSGAKGLNWGGCTDQLTQQLHRYYGHDNLYYGINGSFNVTINPGATGQPMPPFDAYDLWLVHETFSSVPTNVGVEFTGTPNVDFQYNVWVRDSVFSCGQFGCVAGTGTAEGNATVTAFSPNANFKNDCMIGPVTGTYSFSNFSGIQRPANEAAVFTTPGSNFQVLASSPCSKAASDGLDMGANIPALNAATAGVVQTLGCPVTLTNVSPATFTHTGGTGLTLTGTCFLNESGLGIIIGGAGPTSTISTISCTVNTCTVVMTQSISLQVNDTVNIQGGSGNPTGQFTVASVTDGTHYTYTDTGVGTVNGTGGTANRISPGNACTSVMVVSSTSITCNAPTASGAVTTGPVSVFVSQWGIPVQFNGANYN